MYSTLSAFYGRIETAIGDLPNPYVLNKPKICVTSTRDRAPPEISPDYSINWTGHSESIEVINSRTGRVMVGNSDISRLTKRILFQKYSDTMKRLPYASVMYHVVGGNYAETKLAARKYQVHIFWSNYDEEIVSKFKLEILLNR